VLFKAIRLLMDAVLGVTNNMEVISNDPPPYGSIFLTFLYLTFGLTVHLIRVCNDDSLGIVQWSTSFFMAGMTFIFSLHLGVLVSSNLGFLAFAVLSIGYVFEGCIYLVFENAPDLSDGLQRNSFLYYLFSIVQHGLWTISAVILGWNFRISWNDLHYESIGTKLSRVCSVALILSLVSLVIASMWSAIFASSDVQDSTSDEASSKSEQRDEVALQYFRINQWIWYGLLFLFFAIIAGELRSMLRTISNEIVIIIWGLSSQKAAGGVIVFLLASSGFFIFIILATVGVIKTSNSAMTYILFVIHYCMLMTFFFLHNLVFALSHLISEDEDSKVDAKEDSKVDVKEDSKVDMKGLVLNKGYKEIGGGDTVQIQVTNRTKAIEGLEGTEVVSVAEKSSKVDLKQRSTKPKRKRETPPTEGPSAIKAIWRTDSGKRPEITRIRSSRLRIKNADSRSSYVSSSSSSFSLEEDDGVDDDCTNDVFC
jgi:hypothetical protein